MKNILFCALVTSCALCGAAKAGVVPYSNHNDWLAAIGDPGAVTTIDFTGFPETTIITDQSIRRSGRDVLRIY